MVNLAEFRFEVAQVAFRVIDEAQTLLRTIDPGYAAFLLPLDDPRRPDEVQIKMRVGIPADMRPVGEVLTDAPPWFLARNDQGYVLSRKRSFTESSWVAQISHNFRQVDVYCAEKVLTYPAYMGTYLALTFPLEKILLMHLLPSCAGAIVHTAAVIRNGRAFLFPGKSGAGKSTLSRLLRNRQFGELLSDDRVIVRKIEDAFQVFGIPWSGAGTPNVHAPLAALVFIRHGAENRITPITRSETLANLMPVVSVPWYDRQTTQKILDVCEALIKHVPAYSLSFQPDERVVDVLEQFIATANLP